MSKHRVRRDIVSINEKDIKSFYDKRAELADEKGWEVVSLGAEDPTIAARVYDYDRDILIPKLKLKENARVFEIGCGLGRVASMVGPHCEYYCGVDFSENLINKALQINKRHLNHMDFHVMSATQAMEKSPQYFGGPFDCIIMFGVCIYINDFDLKNMFEKMPQMCRAHGVICLKETSAYNERLTLNNFYSDALNSNYNAIYRTREEYEELTEPLIKSGFVMREQFFLPEEVGRKRKETNGLCMIFSR